MLPLASWLGSTGLPTLLTWSSRALPPGGWRFEDEARSDCSGIRAGPCAARGTRRRSGGADADTGKPAADLCGVLAAQARQAHHEALRRLHDHDRDLHRTLVKPRSATRRLCDVHRADRAPPGWHDRRRDRHVDDPRQCPRRADALDRQRCDHRALRGQRQRRGIRLRPDGAPARQPDDGLRRPALVRGGQARARYREELGESRIRRSRSAARSTGTS